MRVMGIKREKEKNYFKRTDLAKSQNIPALKAVDIVKHLAPRHK